MCSDDIVLRLILQPFEAGRYGGLLSLLVVFRLAHFVVFYVSLVALSLMGICRFHEIVRVQWLKMLVCAQQYFVQNTCCFLLSTESSFIPWGGKIKKHSSTDTFVRFWIEKLH